MAARGRFKNIVGNRFGKLVVVKHTGSKGGHATWECKCDCGGSRIARSVDLNTGKIDACGCTWGSPTHRHTGKRGKSPTYKSWQNMIARCTQPSNPAFYHYQKRGITVCDRWRTFANFLDDMGERPSREHSIERINNDGGYEPSNCRWATKREQANNRLTNKTFMFCGKTYTLAELSRVTGVSKEVLRSRLCRSKLPWTVEGAVTTPTTPRTMSRAGFCC